MDLATRQAEEQALGLPLVLRLRPGAELTDEQLYALCRLNDPLRIERTAEGALVLMAPAGFESGAQNAEITRQLGNWAVQDGTGVATDSSTGYRLPNRAMRAPDAAWIANERLAAIPPERRKQFLPACPDFVIELRSPSDRLADVQAKLEEYLANGARLGWLVDPAARQVYVYRPGASVERLDGPATVSAEPVLPGFVLDLSSVW